MKGVRKLNMLFAVVLCLVMFFALAACNNEVQQKLVSDAGITVEGGGFEKGSALVTESIETTGEKGREIVTLLEEQNYNKELQVNIYDIFVAKDGNEVQPDGKVKITIPAPFESENGYVTFHVKDDDSVETLVTTYAEGKISFETDSFSYFVVAAANNPSEAKKYTFTATLGGEGQGTIYYLSFPYSTYQNTVSEGTEIKLRATAYGGFAFTGWYVVGEIFDEFVSADEEYTFTVNSDMTVYAKIELTFTFDALVSTGSGNLEVDGENVGGVFRKECVVGTTVKVKAIGDENYEFEGWYTSEATPVLISTDAEYTFTIDGNVQVLARFKEKVKSLSLDGANAGFENGQAVYSIGEENQPSPADVIVYGVTLSDRSELTKDVDYTIDLGGLDFEKVGTYTITYTYVKDTTVKATLTVVVEGPNYLLKVGQQGAGGTVSINGGQASSLESNAFSEKFKAKTRITLVAATRTSDYIFLGWYEVDDTVLTHLVLKDTPVSTDATFAFDMPEKAYTVYAVFEAKVTGLILDGANAGITEGKATYTIGEANKPTPENVIVSGATVLGSVPFTKDVDYTIDLGGLDFERVGTYAITYTYVKDTNIKETLTIEVVAPKFTFSAVTENANGSIYYNNEVQPNGYQAELEANTSVTLKAVAKNDYEFVGWYTATDVPEFISESAEYTFVTGNADKYVMARFAAKILYLRSDSSNAGFNDNEKSATVTIGDSVLPDPQAVLIYAGTAEGDVLLAKNVDYTIELGGLDFSQEGTYTITYRHTKNTSLTTTLTVYVVAAQTPVTINLSYSGTADPVKYNGGRAAYVFKSSILNNGEACDIESLGLFYEWRDHTTKAVVAVAKDDTWDSTSAHYPSPAVPGTYDFVVYKLENEVKTDLLTVTRTIVENQFAVVTDLSSLSEYVCYTFIAKAGDNYYAMSNPFSGNSEREAILVTPDSNGVISLGNNYEYVFRPYNTGKTSSSGLVCYGCRTGNGLNRTGNLVLWGTGGIEYKTSTSADYTVTFVLNADGTITVHAPFCEGTLRLVYDATSGKFMFTAKKAVDDTRTSYPVYLYGEYTEPVVEPKETYEFFGKLSKAYDGNAVSFNVYKEVNICTENGEDVAAVLKNGTGRFVWTDAKGNVISVGTPDENGNVTGPSAIGSYRLVFQTLQKGENGMEWVEKAVLHSFEITAPAEVN
ncbi:MAG: InlB B-repeat-containing protein [Clostridiales bacterium]|nr:InlB B-repeat-containing protein [Clostridiales bacterium]MDY5726088.1 InlB B-repeat-containing protein [Eubacteriales bacterium]